MGNPGSHPTEGLLMRRRRVIATAFVSLSTVGDATVVAEAALPVGLSTCERDMSKTTVTVPPMNSPGSVEGGPFDTTLRPNGAAVSSRAFGASQAPTGSSLATSAGRADVVPGLG